jgi:hypothetical protein
MNIPLEDGAGNNDGVTRKDPMNPVTRCISLQHVFSDVTIFVSIENDTQHGGVLLASSRTDFRAQQYLNHIHPPLHPLY